LQDKAALDEIFAAIQEVQNTAHSVIRRKPVVMVKVAPDLSFEALDEVLEVAAARSVAGIVATNTTITRPQTDSARLKNVYAETGGLSGRPLCERSTDIIRHIFKQTRGRLPIIGVGGIFSAEDAWEKIAAGASLVQIYTALVFEGPGLPHEIVTGLIERMSYEGFKDLKEVVGSEFKKSFKKFS
jgi:dihydroorotate dehydrogenase